MTGLTSTKTEGRGWRLLAWAGAVAGMLAAFWHDWTLPLLGIDLRTKPGHVLIEAQEAVKAALIGSLLGGRAAEHHLRYALCLVLTLVSLKLLW